MEGVRDAEARRSVTVRLQLANGQWRNLILVAYPDYGDIRIGKITPETGAWPPGQERGPAGTDGHAVPRGRHRR